MARWILGIFLFFSSVAICGGQPVTVLVPGTPAISAQSASKKKAKAAKDEADILIALMDPHKYTSEDMERPQFMAALYYGGDGRTGEPELRNLLGDVEEIRYNGKKAWGVNVPLTEPGLYQFVMEGRPWWNPATKSYLHQQAKVLLPVRTKVNGWEASFGQSFEILPLTRPFGLVAPALFSARVLLDGKPLANLPIRMVRLNPGKAAASGLWEEDMEARTNQDGQFSFVLNESGWWACEASTNGAPLKGPNGEMSPVERSTVLWVYAGEKRK